LWSTLLALGALAAEPPSVLLITLDTTRADRLGVYGHAQARTPHIDALAGSGLRFERAYATCPLTIPSHASLFTGQVPPTHGVRDNGDFRLSDDAITLAERFAAAGYATLAFTAAFPTQAQWGFGQGFDTYHDALSALPVDRDWRAWRTASDVVDDALSTLAEVEGPRFVWVHLFDAHWPYDPPEPFASQLQGRPYDGELAYLDHEVGRLVEAWRRVTQDGVIALTADHGEALGDGGEQTHGFLLLDGTLRVPLILVGPGLEPGVVAEPVSHIDLAPTLLSLVGLELHEGLQGRDLRGGGSALVFSEALTGQYNLGLSSLTSVTSPAGRFVSGAWDSFAPFGPQGIPPVGVRGQYPDESEELATLRGSYRVTQGESAALDAEAWEQLLALGYLGGPALEVTSDVDPRDVIEIVPLTWHARRALGAGRLEAAAQWIAQLEAPLAGTYGLDLLRGQQLRAQGDAFGAIDVLSRLHDRAPSHDVALMLGALGLELADWHAAARWYERALDSRSNSAQAMAGLVRSALAMGQLQWAGELAEAFLDVHPDHLQLVLVRGELLLMDGHPTSALEEARWALELSPTAPGAYALAGRALFELGQADAAIDALWEALAWNPYDLGVRVHLVEALLDVDRNAEAVRTLDQAESVLPVAGPLRDLWTTAHDALDDERALSGLSPLPR